MIFRWTDDFAPRLLYGFRLIGEQTQLREDLRLIEPDMQISRIRLSDKTSRICFCVRRHRQFLNTFRS